MTEPGGSRSALLVVDAANVVGARPDGWWRDRAGAAERLVARLASARAHPAAGLRERRVVVVLEGRAVHAVTDGHPGVEVVRAATDGDSAVVDLVAAADADDVVVVTSDRELRRRVVELGAHVRGAGWLRDLLDDVVP